MKPEKVWKALELYYDELAEYAVERQFEEAEYAAKGVPRVIVLAHCRWMARHCLDVFRKEFEAAVAALPGYVDPAFDAATQAADNAAEARKPLEKAMRWLGYIQGVCSALGVFSCNELRDHSRGGEGEFKTAAEEHAEIRVRRTTGIVDPKPLVEMDFAGAEVKAPMLCQSLETAPKRAAYDVAAMCASLMKNHVTYCAVSPCAVCGAYLAELKDTTPAEVGIKLLTDKLTACFCDDGRGEPNCAKCVEMREAMHRLWPQSKK